MLIRCRRDLCLAMYSPSRSSLDQSLSSMAPSPAGSTDHTADAMRSHLPYSGRGGMNDSISAMSDAVNDFMASRS